ncbi:chondroitin proteoglycan 2 [Aplysia californica]|uniref:Chondroitin proteoglycan 2 n=1 Tax=Aplysia californica TaxID=6500 RepID=A0ABM0ZXR2_APLCA|nr:chondroitin proteoglycan 2 [Aplysia californica]
MNPALVILILLPAAVLSDVCDGKPDGNIEIGCRAYTECKGGVATAIACDTDMAYNQDTGVCDNAANVPPPCGVFKNCTNINDGHYADTDNSCKSYYTCISGQFVGHNFCPAALIFNEAQQSCDWPKATPPPCGTASS